MSRGDCAMNSFYIENLPQCLSEREYEEIVTVFGVPHNYPLSQKKACNKLKPCDQFFDTAPTYGFCIKVTTIINEAQPYCSHTVLSNALSKICNNAVFIYTMALTRSSLHYLLDWMAACECDGNPRTLLA